MEDFFVLLKWNCRCQIVISPMIIIIVVGNFLSAELTVRVQWFTILAAKANSPNESTHASGQEDDNGHS